MPVDEFGEYRDYLMVLARSLIAVDLRGRIDPSDLVQDTLYDALRDRPQSRAQDPGGEMAWLRRVLKSIWSTACAGSLWSDRSAPSTSRSTRPQSG